MLETRTPEAMAYWRIHEDVGLAISCALAMLAVGCVGDPGIRAEPTLASAVQPAVSAMRVGPTAWDPWELWHVARPSRPRLDVFAVHDAQKRPVVVLLQGSGCQPLFSVSSNADGPRTSTLFFDAAVKDRVARVHFVAVEKRGVVSFRAPPKDDEEPTCSPEYEAGVARSERVADIVDTIEALSRQPWAGPVLVAGHSEGADLAASVGHALGTKVAAVGLFSSAGPSQLFDMVLAAHRTGKTEAIREAFSDVQRVIDPQSTGRWRGHSMVRWKSYAVESSPLDEMRASDVPVFVAHGSRDATSPVESADLFVVELLRANVARSVAYVRVEDADHLLRSPSGEKFGPSILDRFLNWALSPSKARGVVLGPPF